MDRSQNNSQNNFYIPIYWGYYTLPCHDFKEEKKYKRKKNFRDEKEYKQKQHFEP